MNTPANIWIKCSDWVGPRRFNLPFANDGINFDASLILYDLVNAHATNLNPPNEITRRSEEESQIAEEAARQEEATSQLPSSFISTTALIKITILI